MKSIRSVTPIVLLVASLAAVLAGCVAAPSPRTAAAVEVDVVFYEALAPWGDWVWIAEWGWVWSPRGVAPDWRPYTYGYWAPTAEGWMWISSWEWGWAPFHYGRWARHQRYGWVWQPGSVWAPAWVAWRIGDGWIGWAPLPPWTGWRLGLGLDPWPVTIDAGWWSFVPRERFGDSQLRQHVVPGDRDLALIRDSRDVTRYEDLDRRAVERGLPADPGGATRAVPRRPIEDVARPGETTRQPTGDGERVRVYRPEVQKAPGRPSTGARRTRPPERPDR